MTTLLVLLAAIALLALGYATLREILGDGAHADHQPPASHHTDVFGQRFGSA